MKYLGLICYIILIVGGLDMGCSAALGYSLLGKVFVGNAIKIIQILVGVSAIYVLATKFFLKGK